MNKKHISAAAALVMAFLLASCGNREEPAAPEADTSFSQTAVSITTPAVPTEPFDLNADITDTMYERALLNEGNKARLAKAMKKAQSGESIVLGTIGGSITQGSSAADHKNCYAERFGDYFREKFPQSDVTLVNAGIGGTNSYLGVHRADEQLLAASPDIVIVEFSVNDTDKVMNKYSYDSLVRKILNADSQPAVILLFTTQENGTSLQDTHREIGAAYDLPMLSYREIVYPEVSAGTLDWKDISPDNIHPNDVGHGIIGQLISRYLDSVYDELDSIDTSDTSFDTKAYTADYYKDAKIYGASAVNITDMNGFEYSGNSFYPELFPDNIKTVDGGSITFEAECKCMGFFFLKQTDGKGGKYEVYVDGTRKSVLDADFTGGWGTYGETQSVMMSKESEKHTIEIKLAEDSEKTALTILGIMMS